MRVLKIEKLTNEKWLNLFAATYQHNGEKGRWLFASRKKDPQNSGLRADGAVVVPILREQGQPPRLVTLKTFRVPVGATSR